MQLTIWKSAIDYLPKDSKFILIGTCRGSEDEEIVDNLKKMAKDLNIENSVEFALNKDNNEVLEVIILLYQNIN